MSVRATVRSGLGAIADRAAALPWVRILAFASLSMLLGVAGVFAARNRERAFGMVQDHPYFRVDRVVIRGVGDLVDEAELQAWLGFRPDQSLWNAEPRRVVTRIEAHPMIQTASVRRVFPSTLEIFARERKPAAISVQEDLYYLDRRGEPFGPLAPDHDRDYPVFTGVSVGTDGQQRWALRRALRLLRRGRSDATQVDVSELHLDAEEGLILYPSHPRVPVFLGWTGWERRLERAERVLSTWKGAAERLARIDLRYRDQVVVGLREPLPPIDAGTQAGVVRQETGVPASRRDLRDRAGEGAV